MTARNIRCYLSYLDKLVDEYNNTYHRSVYEKPIYADCSALTEELEMNGKAHKFKVGARVRITRHKYFQQRLHHKLVKRKIYD